MIAQAQLCQVYSAKKDTSNAVKLIYLGIKFCVKIFDFGIAGKWI